MFTLGMKKKANILLVFGLFQKFKIQEWVCKIQYVCAYCCDNNNNKHGNHESLSFKIFISENRIKVQ